MSLTPGQWQAVDAELEQARANTTVTSDLSTEQASDWGKM